jgi:SAM-dependent methyltransferase
VSRAADRWRDQLEAWAIPQRLLDAVPDSPYSWTPELWSRGSTAEDPDDPTMRILGRFLGDSGSLLDVGAGTGRISLPFAERGHRVTAVERNSGMAEALRAAAAEMNVDVALTARAWPEAAEAVGVHDVVVSAHVVYDVAEIGPFLEALHGAAGRAVVLEATPRHPWSRLTPFYERLHGLRRPHGPTIEDLVGVIRETVGVAAALERWTGRRTTRFLDRDELLEFFRRRLVLPTERFGELEDLLAPFITGDGGRFVLDLGEPEIVTAWWAA